MSESKTVTIKKEGRKFIVRDEAGEKLFGRVRERDARREAKRKGYTISNGAMLETQVNGVPEQQSNGLP